MSNETLHTSVAAAPPDAPPAPPAYFLSLTVENFRCFGPTQTLDLSRGDNRPAPWTIILGENGVGKTTLLQCLAAFHPEDAIHGFPFDTDKLYLMGASGSLRARERATSSTFTVTCWLGTNLQTTASSASTGIMSIQTRHDGGSLGGHAIDTRNLICYGYGASRRMGKASLSEQRTEDTTASLFSDDVDLINAEEWLLQADYAASRAAEGNTRAGERRDRVIEILKALLPDVEGIRIREAEEEISAPTVEFKTHYGWVRLKDLSLGYRTMTTWMVDLASRLFDRYPKSTNPLAEPAVVLVDEIDLHLHPRWQRTLLSFLSALFPNTQFIATAHSPLFVQAAEDANIVLLRREGDHVVIDNDVERIKNLRVDQILTSELFGLESARPPQVVPALEERQKILSKPRLTKADEARLTELEAQIGDLPTGETPEDLQAMDIIRRAAELLKT